MKALTIWQPWASLMATGAKKIETRGWRTHYRGDIVICSAKRKIPLTERDDLYRLSQDRKLAPLADIIMNTLPLGQALAIVTLADVAPAEQIPIEMKQSEMFYGDYSPGRFGWITTNLRRIKDPFPVKGQQGIWNLMMPNWVEFI